MNGKLRHLYFLEANTEPKSSKTLLLRAFFRIGYCIRFRSFLNSSRNETKYRQLLVEPMYRNKLVHFVNSSTRTVAVMSRSLTTFFNILKELDCKENMNKPIFNRLINTTIQLTCYICCFGHKVMTTITKVVLLERACIRSSASNKNAMLHQKKYLMASLHPDKLISFRRST